MNTYFSRITLGLCAAVLVLLLGSASAWAQTTYHVDISCGDDEWSGLSPVCKPPDGPKATIQAGIAVAQDGDTVLVADGTYTGPGNRDLDLHGRAITVRSENGPEDCTIDCQAGGRGFNFHSGETEASVVAGFTIINGDAERGGGVYCSNASSPKISQCTIRGNTAVLGGGIYCEDDSNPTITNSTMTLNSGFGGGGIYCEDSSPTITNSTVTGNSAELFGGGIGCRASDLTISNCTIAENMVSGESGYPRGGGIFCTSESNLTITDCTIADNVVLEGEGGGIVCGGGSVTIDNCVISGNGGDYGGHGITCNNTAAVITGCTIVGNLGAGIRCSGSVGIIADCTIAGNRAGVVCTNDCSMTIADCTVTGNSGSGVFVRNSSPIITTCTITENSAAEYGGGVYCEKSSGATITNCTITGNTAQWRGGGIFCLESNPTISNCTIAENMIYDPGWPAGGGGVYCYLSSPTITNCTIAGNLGAGIYCIEVSSPTITGCTIAENTAVEGGGILSSFYSHPTITNCTITWNMATGGPYYQGQGGGVYSEIASRVMITGCTITGNTARSQDGGGVYGGQYSNPTITNCILWSNMPQEFVVDSGSPVYDVTYSNVQGGSGEPWFGEGSIDVDPLFAAGPLGEFYLSQQPAGQPKDSPCVDAGSDTAENLGLDTRTTRTDSVPDSGIVDIGYHYPLAALPDDFEVIRGRHTSGDLPDLFRSDDLRLVVQSGITLDDQEPPIWAVLDGVSPADSPSEIRFLLEARVDTSEVTQTIELFNFVTQYYEEVDSRSASFNEDLVVEVVVEGDLTRFIDPDSRAMSARLTWMPDPPVSVYPWTVGIDQAVWTVSP